MTTHHVDIRSLIGRRIVDQTGERVGTVSQVYLDDATGEPEWITVRAGLLAGKETFVPLSGSSMSGEDLRVPVTKERVKNAPAVDADEHLSPQQESELYRYYGVAAPQRGAPAPSATGPSGPSGKGMPAGTAAGTAAAGTAGGRGWAGAQQPAGGEESTMTRSEERMRVHTEEHETGRIRLHKYVVTEDVTQTVPISHEEVRLVREPITEENREQAMRGPQFRENEFELTLHEERPIVETVAVPVERVRLTTERVTGERTISGTIRKEEVRVEGDDEALAFVRERGQARASGPGRHASRP